VVVLEFCYLFTVLYQRLAVASWHTRRATRPNDWSTAFFTFDPLSGWIHHRLALGSKKLAIGREDCVPWHLCTTYTLLEVHIRQAVCHFARDTTRLLGLAMRTLYYRDYHYMLISTSQHRQCADKQASGQSSQVDTITCLSQTTCTGPNPNQQVLRTQHRGRSVRPVQDHIVPQSQI